MRQTRFTLKFFPNLLKYRDIHKGHVFGMSFMNRRLSNSG
jgi:hypothetical protein